MKKIVNVETGEVIERELTAEEIAQQESDIAAAEIEAIMKESKAAKKAALLAQLGITEDEAKLLLG